MRAVHSYKESDQKLYLDLLKKTEAYSELSPQYKVLLILKFIFYFGVLSLIWLLILSTESQLLFYSSYIAFGIWGILLALNFAHDFAHDTVFKNRSLNLLGFIFLYAILGAHAESWKLRHTEAHHVAPNVGGLDTDLNMVVWIRLIPTSPFKNYHKYQPYYLFIVYALYSIFWIFIKDPLFVLKQVRKREVKTVFYVLSFFVQKLFYFSIILFFPLMFSNHPLSTVLIGFFLMHIVQSLFLSLTFMSTHHVVGASYPEINLDGRISVSWMRNQINCSNDFHPFSPVANFIFGGFNNHIAHHLFPHIHHFHYPKVNKIIYPILEKNGFNLLNNTYFASVYSHFKLLKLRGTNQ
jgi:linoleoyl-CoA desaturase